MSEINKETVNKDKTKIEELNALIEENYISELNEGQSNKYIAVKWDR